MLALTEQGKTEHLAAVSALVRAKVPADEQAAIERFLAEYYRQVDPDDLAELEPADIYGAALSHLAFARRRDSRSPKVRVFNPSIEEHGWQSTHTVVEIVNDDMPFLVDSVTMEVNRHSLALHLIVHPVISNRRNATGKLVEAVATTEDAVRESFMHVEVDRIPDAPAMEALAADLARVLNDVRVVVSDWRAMLGRLEDIIGDLERRPPPIGTDEVEEGRAFLRWLASDHFTFLGYRTSDLTRTDGTDALTVIPSSGLGILRGRDDERPSASFAALPPEARAYARVKDLLLVTKSNSRSTVHRPGYLDYIGIKRYDERGEVCGEHRFLGLYTHTTYSLSPAAIPVLRRKVANVIARAGFTSGGHGAKALDHVLETYPRDELFQIGEDELLANALGILHLGERQRLRLFVRRDGFERYCVCLIYAPREHYTTDLRRKWQALLTQAFNGVSSEFNVFLSESVLARILITVRTIPGKIPPYDVPELEGRLAAASRRWGDDLRQALLDTLGEARGNHACRRFAAAFPAAYREDYPPRNAVPDIETMERALASGELGMNLYRPVEAPPGTLRFKLFHPGRPAVLSDSLPMLERMGLSVLEQRPYRIAPEGTPPVWIEDLGLATRDGTEIEIDALRDDFEDTFGRVFAGAVENDGFNRLVLAARLDADEIVVLRAYAKYLHQIAFPLSQSFIESTLAANPEIARMLVNLFRLRFDPERADEEAAASQMRALEAALDRVDNLNEDRVLRQYLALVLATLRTNHWRRDAQGNRRSFLSFKLDPAKVPGLPEPKPMFEIFVYSPRFEGVHLRGGQRRARRAALVRPAGGFPHRGAGAREGADGQEHGHRAGRFQRRFRPEESTARRRSRSLHEGRGGLLPELPARSARPDRQPGRRAGDPAAAGAPPRSGRPVSGGRGGQGHRDLLRLRQRDQPGVRILACRCVRLRRLGRLRPQGDGHHGARRLGVGETPLPRDGHRHPDAPTSPWPASATCPATCSATACCCRGTSGWWRRSTTATSFSIPTPTPRRASSSASGSSACRARRGPITTPSSSRKAAASGRAA